MHLYTALRYDRCVSQFYFTVTCSIATSTLTLRAFTPHPQGVTALGWYSLHLPTTGWPVWVDLGGWLHTEINVPHLEIDPDTITHPSTNRARRRLTSLIENHLLQGCIWRGVRGVWPPARGSWPPESSAEPLWGSTLTLPPKNLPIPFSC